MARYTSKNIIDIERRKKEMERYKESKVNKRKFNFFEKLKNNKFIKRHPKLLIVGAVGFIGISTMTTPNAHNFSEKAAQELENLSEDENLNENIPMDESFLVALRNINFEKANEQLEAIEILKREGIVKTIVKEYNKNVGPEERIGEKDIGIIGGKIESDGIIYINSKGEYIENHLAAQEESQEGRTWLNGNDIKNRLNVINKKDETVLFGLAEDADGFVVPVNVQATIYNNETIEKSTIYNEPVDFKTIDTRYELLKKEHQRRIEEQEKQHETRDWGLGD